MRTEFFASVWSCGSWADADAFARCEAFAGVEGPPPDTAPALPWILEIATGGGYVPDPGKSVAEHLDDFARILDAGLRHGPLFATCLGGSDLWPPAEAVEFFGCAMRIASSAGVNVCFETHRARPTFHPVQTADLLRQVPEMRLTCDLSHWCCVCERLVPDALPEIFALCAQRCGHIHARVGYDQGPQVPDPRSERYAGAVTAHLRWWKALAAAAPQETLTITPEFGPDGYQMIRPDNGRAWGDLSDFNAWIAKRIGEALAA